MVDEESRAYRLIPKEARLELNQLLNPALDILDTLGEIGFQDPYEGWDYTGSLTDAMAEMYLQGVRDGYKECNDCWNEQGHKKGDYLTWQ